VYKVPYYYYYLYSYGRNVDNTYHYSINNTERENIESIKDLGLLGVTFDSRLKFSLHINEKNNKAIAFLEL